MQAGRMHPIYTSTRIDWLSIGGDVQNLWVKSNNS